MESWDYEEISFSSEGINNLSLELKMSLLHVNLKYIH